MTRIREFLPRIASFTRPEDVKGDSTRLSQQEISLLTDQEIEEAAESYAKEISVAELNCDSSGRPDRKEGEQATSHLDRLLEYECNKQSERIKKLSRGVNDSFNSLFDGVKASTRRLELTINEFEKLKIKQPTASELAPGSVNINAIQEQLHNQSLDRSMERNQVLEYIRLTGQMIEDSTISLKSLVEASTTLLEVMEQRKSESDKSTRIQVLIAVSSVAVSAILSLSSFFQDRVNYKSGDKWQQELLNSLHRSNQVRARNQEEIRVLKSKFVELQAQVKAAQGSASRAKRNDN